MPPQLSCVEASSGSKAPSQVPATWAYYDVAPSLRSLEPARVSPRQVFRHHLSTCLLKWWPLDFNLLPSILACSPVRRLTTVNFTFCFVWNFRTATCQDKNCGQSTGRKQLEIFPCLLTWVTATLCHGTFWLSVRFWPDDRSECLWIMTWRLLQVKSFRPRHFNVFVCRHKGQTARKKHKMSHAGGLSERLMISLRSMKFTPPGIYLKLKPIVTAGNCNNEKQSYKILWRKKTKSNRTGNRRLHENKSLSYVIFLNLLPCGLRVVDFLCTH